MAEVAEEVAEEEEEEEEEEEILEWAGAEMEEYVVGPERRGDAACRVGGGGGRGPGWQCWRGAVVVGRGEQSDCAVVLQREESYFQVVGAFSRLQLRRKPDSDRERRA